VTRLGKAGIRANSNYWHHSDRPKLNSFQFFNKGNLGGKDFTDLVIARFGER
jgi:hypothetical protein